MPFRIWVSLRRVGQVQPQPRYSFVPAATRGMRDFFLWNTLLYFHALIKFMILADRMAQHRQIDTTLDVAIVVLSQGA